MSNDSTSADALVENTNESAKEKPLLLLDIDGALSPMIGPSDDGADDLLWVTGIEGVAPQLPVWLASLSEHFELVWASSWGDEAGELFGPALGLPTLPFVDFDRISEDWTWKLPCVMEYVRGRDFAWIDDDLGPDAVEAAAKHSHRALLVKTRPLTGITQEHVELLLAFAQEHEAS